MKPEMLISITINNLSCPRGLAASAATAPAPAESHFKDINILGTDFILLNKVRAIQDGNSMKTSLVFHKVHQETEKVRWFET
jgi:hypothetical protein